MAQKITMICDVCEEEFMISDDMDLPPYWIGLQLAVANRDGVISSKELFVQLCSAKCLAKFAESRMLKEKIALVDRDNYEH